MQRAAFSVLGHSPYACDVSCPGFTADGKRLVHSLGGVFVQIQGQLIEADGPDGRGEIKLQTACVKGTRCSHLDGVVALVQVAFTKDGVSILEEGYVCLPLCTVGELQ